MANFLDSLKGMLSGGKVNLKSRFELLREAASGSMSKFYKARDRTNDKIVGLKIVDSEKLAAFEGRFKNLKKPSEGEIASTFDHPYIVKTLEYGVAVDGTHYLVMEFLKGAGMNWVLMTGDNKLDGKRVTYLRQVAEALEAVHQAGFIHRDICPRNLIFTEYDKILKLTDFGIAVPATASFMQPGNRTGTANYMAPELVRRYKTDKRLDIFAFGVTAYEICAGELPFPSGFTGMAAMTHDQPPTDIRKYRPHINPRLAKAIHRCFEAEANDRFASMADFLTAIEGVEKEDLP